jgi:hypothetical protein
MLDPKPYEHKTLKERVESIQEFGAECFLQIPGALNAVRVKTGDSPNAAILEALSDEEDVSLVEVFMSRDEMTAGVISTGCIINGHGSPSEELFIELHKTHPPQSFASHYELASLLEERFSGSKDWRIWEPYLQSLPPLDEQTIERIFVPLLVAGELGNSFVPSMIDELLERNGWSTERIRASYSEEERRSRINRQLFFEETGITVGQIQSTNDLTDAIFPELTEWGGFTASAIIEKFILSHTENDDREKLKNIIKPFMSLFGISGNECFVGALMEFDWFYPEPWSRYEGDFTWYGDW